MCIHAHRTLYAHIAHISSSSIAIIIVIICMLPWAYPPPPSSMCTHRTTLSGGKGFGDPVLFDNAYYTSLLLKPWLASNDDMATMIGLPSDHVLPDDPDCLPFIKVGDRTMCSRMTQTACPSSRWVMPAS